MAAIITDAHSHSSPEKSQKHPLLKCGCKEKVLFQEGEEIILKCRIIKIVDGVAWAKCKRCDTWVMIPIQLQNV